MDALNTAYSIADKKSKFYVVAIAAALYLSK